MQSDAATADAYNTEAPEERREARKLLRDLCREELHGFEEAMGYGMPGYLRDGVGEIGFASQKSYISFYVLSTAALASERTGMDACRVGHTASCPESVTSER